MNEIQQSWVRFLNCSQCAMKVDRVLCVLQQKSVQYSTIKNRDDRHADVGHHAADTYTVYLAIDLNCWLYDILYCTMYDL